MTKTIDTLVEDIYHLFDDEVHVEPSEEDLLEVAQQLTSLLTSRLAKDEGDRETLRFSSLGKHDRQLWYDENPDPDNPPEKLTGQNKFKFLYGDILELLILFLAKQAGHVVERTQEEIEVNGVKGHIDAIIDGTLVDVKSASPYGFKKFKENSIVGEDPFGYVQQLAGYSTVLTPGKAPAWISVNKVDGEICVTHLSQSVVASHHPEQRIEHLKEVLESPDVPPRCHDPVPDGKSGNLKLPTACSYCKDKRRCHPGLRTFIYSTGPRFLTSVARTPDVKEVS